MQNTLLKPKIISVEALAENQAKVVMEPFERGYGGSEQPPEACLASARCSANRRWLRHGGDHAPE